MAGTRRSRYVSFADAVIACIREEQEGRDYSMEEKTALFARIPRVGDVCARNLAASFGSIGEIATATEEQLADRLHWPSTYIGEIRIRSIHETFTEAREKLRISPLGYMLKTLGEYVSGDDEARTAAKRTLYRNMDNADLEKVLRKGDEARDELRRVFLKRTPVEGTE